MKTSSSRRSLLKTGLAAAVIAPLTLRPNYMNGTPLNAPIGLELYTVGKEMDADPFGTLKRVAAVGYKDVELSRLAKTSVKDL